MTYNATTLLQSVGSSYGKTVIRKRPFFSIKSASTRTIDQSRERKIRRYVNKLNEIEALDEDWNGYGAKPIKKELLQEFRNMAVLFVRIPQVFPTADGELQLEYDKKDGAYLELTVPVRGKIEVFEIDKNGAGKEYSINRTFADINKVVKSFYGY